MGYSPIDKRPLEPFKVWCQKVLPAVYDDSLSYSELLNKVVNYLNDVIEVTNSLRTRVEDISVDFESLTAAFAKLVNDIQDYLNSEEFLENVENTVEDYIDSLVLDGTFTGIVEPILESMVPLAVTTWLNEHITETSPPVDDSLSISGAAADALVTGDRIRALEATGLRRLTEAEIEDISDFESMEKGVYFSMSGADIKAKITDFPFTLNDDNTYMVVSYRYRTANSDKGVVEIFSGTKTTYYVGYIGFNDTTFHWGNFSGKIDEIVQDILNLYSRSLRLLTEAEKATITNFNTMPKGVYFSMTGAQIKAIYAANSAEFPFPLTDSVSYIVNSYKYFASNDEKGIVEIFNADKSVLYSGYIGLNDSEINWYNVSEINTTLYNLNLCALKRLTAPEKAAFLNDSTATLMTLEKGVYFSCNGAQLKSKYEDAGVGRTFPFNIIDARTYMVVTYRYEGLYPKAGIIEIFNSNKTDYFIGYMLIADTDFHWKDMSNMPENINKLLVLSNQILENVAINVIDDYVYANNPPYNGVSYNYDTTAKQFTVTGEATDLSFRNLIYSQTAMPYGIKPDSFITLGGEGICDDVYIRCYVYPSPSESYKITKDTVLYLPPTATGLLIRLEVPSGTILPQDGIVVKPYIRRGINTEDAVTEDFNDGIRLLVFGSSFAYSTLGYLPQVMREIMPNKRFILGICYYSGAQFSNFNNFWDNDTAYTEYTEFDTAYGKWINKANTVTGKEAVSKYNWDYIAIQGGGLNKDDYNGFCQRILNYAQKPYTFLFNFSHGNSLAAYEEKADFAREIVEESYAYDVLPCGTAIQNARTTSLNSLGEASELRYDSSPGHLQNGLPVLIGSYTAAFKLCELSGIKPKIYNIQYEPTDSDLAYLKYWMRYQSASIPGHGNCVGVNTANMVLAQRCAMMAIKKPYEVTDMTTV